MTDRAPRSTPPRHRSGRVTIKTKAAEHLTTPPSVTEDEKLFARSTRPAFLGEDPWRVLRIMSEFVDGFDALAEVGPAVTVFGSARAPEDSPIYQQAREIGRSLARDGWAVITGGGPGVMEAANRGCQEAGGLSIGCNIELPHEQSVNTYVDVAIEFRYFFARKTMFVKYADAFVILPGGFGTLDELFEALTLIQTGKIRHFPVVLVGHRVLGRPARLGARDAHGRRDGVGGGPRTAHGHRRPGGGLPGRPRVRPGEPPGQPDEPRLTAAVRAGRPRSSRRRSGPGSSGSAGRG